MFGLEPSHEAYESSQSRHQFFLRFNTKSEGTLPREKRKISRLLQISTAG
jgi:hypothetical protein